MASGEHAKENNTFSMLRRSESGPSFSIGNDDDFNEPVVELPHPQLPNLTLQTPSREETPQTLHVEDVKNSTSSWSQDNSLVSSPITGVMDHSIFGERPEAFGNEMVTDQQFYDRIMDEQTSSYGQSLTSTDSFALLAEHQARERLDYARSEQDIVFGRERYDPFAPSQTRSPVSPHIPPVIITDPDANSMEGPSFSFGVADESFGAAEERVPQSSSEHERHHGSLSIQEGFVPYEAEPSHSERRDFNVFMPQLETSVPSHPPAYQSNEHEGSPIQENDDSEESKELESSYVPEKPTVEQPQRSVEEVDTNKSPKAEGIDNGSENPEQLDTINGSLVEENAAHEEHADVVDADIATKEASLTPHSVEAAKEDISAPAPATRESTTISVEKATDAEADLEQQETVQAHSTPSDKNALETEMMIDSKVSDAGAKAEVLDTPASPSAQENSNPEDTGNDVVETEPNVPREASSVSSPKATVESNTSANVASSGASPPTKEALQASNTVTAVPEVEEKLTEDDLFFKNIAAVSPVPEPTHSVNEEIYSSAPVQRQEPPSQPQDASPLKTNETNVQSPISATQQESQPQDASPLKTNETDVRSSISAAQQESQPQMQKTASPKTSDADADFFASLGAAEGSSKPLDTEEVNDEELLDDSEFDALMNSFIESSPAERPPQRAMTYQPSFHQQIPIMHPKPPYTIPASAPPTMSSQKKVNSFVATHDSYSSPYDLPMEIVQKAQRKRAEVQHTIQRKSPAAAFSQMSRPPFGRPPSVPPSMPSSSRTSPSMQRAFPPNATSMSRSSSYGRTYPTNLSLPPKTSPQHAPFTSTAAGSAAQNTQPLHGHDEIPAKPTYAPYIPSPYAPQNVATQQMQHAPIGTQQPSLNRMYSAPVSQYNSPTSTVPRMPPTRSSSSYTPPSVSQPAVVTANVPYAPRYTPQQRTLPSEVNDQPPRAAPQTARRSPYAPVSASITSPEIKVSSAPAPLPIQQPMNYTPVSGLTTQQKPVLPALSTSNLSAAPLNVPTPMSRQSSHQSVSRYAPVAPSTAETPVSIARVASNEGSETYPLQPVSSITQMVRSPVDAYTPTSATHHGEELNSMPQVSDEQALKQETPINMTPMEQRPMQTPPYLNPAMSLQNDSQMMQVDTQASDALYQPSASVLDLRATRSHAPLPAEPYMAHVQPEVNHGLHLPHPLVSFGPCGTFLTMCPFQSERFTSEGLVMKSTPGLLRFHSLKDFVPEENLFLTDFQGPYIGSNGKIDKAKRKQALAWVEKRLHYLEDQGENEEKLYIYKALGLMLGTDDKHRIRDGVREMLLPNFVPPETKNSTKTVAELMNPSLDEDNTPVVATSSVTAGFLQKIHNFLLVGDRESALTCAMNRKNWAYAILLASSLGKETFQSVVHDFIKSDLMSETQTANVEVNLRVIFQLLSGASLAFSELSSSCPLLSLTQANSAEGNQDLQWKELLCMLLANDVPEQVQAFRHLGELLLQQGRTYAAHLVFLLSMSPIICLYNGKERNPMPLVGLVNPNAYSDSTELLESVMLTEVWELILNLHANKETISYAHLQIFKLYHARVLADYGQLALAKRYCECIGQYLKMASKKSSASIDPSLVSGVRDLSRQVLESSNTNTEVSNSWLGRTVSRPKLDSFWSALESKFSKFVAGDANFDITKDNTVDGPFAKVAEVQETITRASSALALRDDEVVGERVMPYGSVPQSVPTSRVPSPYQPLDQQVHAGPHSANPYVGAAGIRRDTGHVSSSGPYLEIPSAQTSPKRGPYALPVRPTYTPTTTAGYNPYVPQTLSTPAQAAEPAAYQLGQPVRSTPPQGPMSPAEVSAFAPAPPTAETPTRNTYGPTPAAVSPVYAPSLSPQQPYQNLPSRTHSRVPSASSDISVGRSMNQLADAMGGMNIDTDRAAEAKQSASKIAEEMIKREEEEEAKKKQAASTKKSGGMGWFSKLLHRGGNNESANNGQPVYKAKLGEKSHLRYDKEKKRWVNEDGSDLSNQAAPPPPPPKMSMMPRRTATTSVPPPAMPASNLGTIPESMSGLAGPPSSSGAVAQQPLATGPIPPASSPAPLSATTPTAPVPPATAPPAPTPRAGLPRPPLGGTASTTKKTDLLDELLSAPPTAPSERRHKKVSKRYVDVMNMQ
ncbi:multidomain vesicle coat component Sec16 [Schizosaccharomyces japonicus yFS275]|uniref:Protein transport protein sec16 n=1 Tax=Schizosaccharomyces japonicus (strain yFS275 / FY16936) TaxID=402676 RepID=B6JV78_SCHJY|nr:multidomain vesicle coat component Sec16 [Schizosaccharomyces japonicus yFS275]EEB05279.2 multidomain vesicle coat component Sec16 [Schizosaccharomyces japonicus yFS275]